MKKILGLLTLLMAFSCQAAWFAAQGQAPIVNGDVEQARDNAIKDGVRQALLYSGASISSLQQIENGVLASQQVALSGSGEIQGIKLTSERIEDDTLYVDIHVDVMPDSGQACKQQKYAKSLALVRFKLHNREQASDGGLFNLDTVFTGKLNNLLELHTHAFNIRQYINQNVNFDPNLLDARHQAVREQVMAIASRTDSQFVMLGSISDVSLEREKPSVFDLVEKQAPRNFFLTTYLFDGMTGELLDTRHYRERVVWEYSRQHQVDLSSKQFWASAYGQRLVKVMDDVLVNTSLTLECQQPIAKIVAVRDDLVQINLGSANGLKIGQAIKLSHNSSYTDQFGIPRFRQEHSAITTQVVELYKDSAVLQAKGSMPASNIQLNDFALLE
ncbi:flagellar assembly protein T N-terminal domain-containing protein [Motilimonas eburnea]|uniref:flagellar assembly protein T N-terminal domain-containing protein n=1 Tax=Motilimonas eburnea TaxID=1737488 RepID=UPI001E4028C9|nr:flagellar assembly protein T N-terminal domain-containing protein [Motilimonas eburnea]MCE2571569.1 flagella assembly protein FlgT [Motilimonas eburnea]